MTSQTGTGPRSAPATGARVGRPASPRRRAVRRFVPPQHGAWAMLLLPWLAGVLTVGFRWPHLPLLVAWLSGYLLSYYLLLAVKTRRPERFRGQLTVYAIPTVLLGGLVVAAVPSLLWYAPCYALLLAVNVGYAARRDERALLNDLASVVQSCLMVFVCATIAHVPPAGVTVAFVTLLAYLAGTVLYVKTMIRERDSIGYRRASITFHLLTAAGMFLLNPIVGAGFLLLAARAWALPGRQLKPVHVGVIEIGASLLVLLATVIS
ncbi:YwiC-like family protein [Dactylosporangium roseum]|uniref:YwiC-like family protein n=1 Tax=Dactylosporangium roseum TaxID=47989 RepID=A0ABY5Z4K3_9ACTN|nr:YwiC-like family protein [Dactylosporangium roseum]UWZ36589.1 YwiC-like family protein [Dactylosporangium roseum]